VSWNRIKLQKFRSCCKKRLASIIEMPSDSIQISLVCLMPQGSLVP